MVQVILYVTESLWRVTLVLSGRGMRRRTISDIYTVSLVSAFWILNHVNTLPFQN